MSIMARVNKQKKELNFSWTLRIKSFFNQFQFIEQGRIFKEVAEITKKVDLQMVEPSDQ